MILERIPEIKALNASEKMELVSEIWEDLAAQMDESSIDESVVRMLEKRAEEYRLHPQRVITWEEARKKYLPVANS